MKKILFVFFATFLLFNCFQTVVLATDSPARVEKRNEVQQRVEENQLEKEKRREEMKKRVEERKMMQEEEIKEKRREKLEYHWRLLGNRLLATIERLETLVGRIESRLLKLKEAYPDLDTTDIEEQLSETKELLEDANAKYEEVKVIMQKLLEADDPNESYEDLKEAVGELKDILVDVHRMLVHIIEDIKGLRIGNST